MCRFVSRDLVEIVEALLRRRVLGAGGFASAIPERNRGTRPRDDRAAAFRRVGRDGDTEQDGGGRLPVKRLAAGLAALCAAAMAIGIVDGVPQGRRHGQALADSGAGLASARGAVPPPAARLCFCGPGGEPVDFPADGPRLVRVATP